eukprot:COSAG06_NODE_2932_length_6073_cov_5.295782_4_plen_243_part_00
MQESPDYPRSPPSHQLQLIHHITSRHVACRATACSRGELSAAYDGLASALGVFTPFLWANLYAFFQRLPEDAVLKKTFGPGGHFIVAALFRLISCLVLRAVPAEHLHIEDAVEEPPKTDDAAAAGKTDAEEVDRFQSRQARLQRDATREPSPKAKRLKSMLDPNAAAGFPRGLRQREKILAASEEPTKEEQEKKKKEEQEEEEEEQQEEEEEKTDAGSGEVGGSSEGGGDAAAAAAAAEEAS